jgi:ubiquinone/menaquinone biosynthesis C-methylase UbiE
VSPVEKEPEGLERWFSVDGAAAMRALGIEAGWRVLDFGCGPGRYAVPLAQVVGAGGEVIAADKKILSIHRLRKSAERRRPAGKLTIERRDAMEVLAGIERASLDAVLLFDVLHHVKDLSALAGELARAVRDGGLAIVYPSEGPHPGRVDMDEVTLRLGEAGFAPAGEKRLCLPHAGEMITDVVHAFRKTV